MNHLVFSGLVVPQKKPKPPVAKDLDPLVKNLTGEILRRSEEQGLSRAKLAKKARRGASTWFGWRNGSREPTLLDLQAFASAVGLNVGLLPQDAVDGTRPAAESYGRVTNVNPETADVVTVMEKASNELRSAIKAKVLEMVTERASHPLDADEEESRPRVRSK